MLYFIAYSDLICLALVIYVWIRMFSNPVFSARDRKSLLGTGIVLIVILVLDEAWMYFYWMGELTQETADLLNTLASLEFALAPVALIFVIMLHIGQWDVGDWIAVAACIALAILNLLNIRYQIIFSHTESFEMVYKPYAKWFYLAYLVLLSYILFHDFAHTFRIDREDSVLIIFVIVMVAIGLLGSFFTAEVDTVWVCCAVAYLMLYLAVARLYDKHDPVTGLQNRNAFMTMIYRLRKRRMTVASFDLNHLKIFNDKYGHKTGDRYLRAFALTMNDSLEKSGVFFRTGGDEFFFVTLLPGDEVQQMLEKIALRPKCDPKYGDFPLDFSFGVAERKEGEAVSSMLDRADEIMYAYKRRTEKGSRESAPAEE